MGCWKVEVKRIENRVSRQATFSKRRKGLLKKAHELAVLCDVDVGLIVFSERGKLFEYPNPPASLTDLIRRYEAVTNTQPPQETHCTDHQQQMLAEIGRLRPEYEQLEARLRTYMGEDLSSVASVDELDKLEQQLELALSKVRARKDELLIHLTDELQLRINGSGHRQPSPPFAYVLKVLAVLAMAALAAPPLAAASATEHGHANVSVTVAAPAPYSYVLPMPNASTPTVAPPPNLLDDATDGGKDKPNDKLLSTVLLGCSAALVAILLAFAVWECLTGRQHRQLNENARQHSLSNIRVVNLAEEVADVHKDCDICLEPYRSGDAVGVLPCDHFFHEDCIKTWIKDGITPTCPSCRAVV